MLAVFILPALYIRAEKLMFFQCLSTHLLLKCYHGGVLSVLSSLLT